ncbi:hypothetical protein JI664_21660 [Rhodobacter sp. NTK016B]|uniref:hypothetical protein n=1 Tax=Rhodobacter sp. NTK016B TaxID=2759676 RepID=UPI001A8E2C9B|nr:hypothetical protein [Rhodobacter sp. NTK016B]MBN8294595.1 hypothetical protein [Rhodobacter sp. NTK016B]
MRALIRSLLLIGLVLGFVTGSVAMASAHYQMRGAGQIVICTGFGATTITLDANGNPVDDKRILCPECTPALAALTETTTPLPVLTGTLTPVTYVRRDIPMPAPEAPVHRHSRAPPVPV